ncbi:hypothetical protein QAD02_011043 [Eretmocerus hayati]|uniref:Uncharacterized protein n=1 Tax=Eretmocerus hayati TaxID=131215 RepID=A0ACC2NVX6_9HYME|nr:hypothetical protein QAD02_011043 [Eretmocerus hayati]
MSTRWYPLYLRGNPQLRIYLPNFWMKLIKPEYPNAKNVVEFHCSMEMTRYDVRNYLEKIYKVPVIKVHTRIAMGKFRKNGLGTIIKDDDMKIAYVYLPRYEKFVFPDLFDKDEKGKEKEKEREVVDEAELAFQQRVAEVNKTRPGHPPWFIN